MRELEGQHFGTDEYVDARRFGEAARARVAESRRDKPRLPSKKVPGYGDHTITLDEWRELQ